MSLSQSVSQSISRHKDCFSQAVSRLPVTPDDWVRSPTISCDNFDGQGGTGTDLSSQYFSFLSSASLDQRSLLHFTLIPPLSEGQAE